MRRSHRRSELARPDRVRPGRRFPLALLLAAAASGCALQVDAQDLIAQERSLARTLRSGERSALEAYLAEEFRLSYVDPGDAPAVVARDEWLESGTWRLGEVSLGSARPTVESIGEGLFAVELELVREQVDATGRAVRRTERVTDLWVRRDGRWQLVNRFRAEPDALDALDALGAGRTADGERTANGD